MAIWQFCINFIPEDGVRRELKNIPKKLPKRYLRRQTFLSFNLDEIDEPLAVFWKGIKRSAFLTLIERLNNELPEIDWLKDVEDILSWGDSDRNDLTLNLSKGDEVENFGCRIDLRNIDESFVNLIIDICINYNLLITDSKGRVISPNRLALGKLISNSNPAKFVADPKNFVEKFIAGKIKPE